MTEGNASGGKHSGIFYNQGDLIQRIEYQPFGQEKYVLNPNLQTDPSFTGQKYDIESGLYFYKSRYYNPKLARFIQPDTVNPDPGNSQAYNKYAYVANNPLKYVDPSGHSFWGWFKKLAGAFLGALVGLAVTVATLGALGVAGGTIGAMIANASLGELVIAGAVGGAAGGLIGGAITGGFPGAIKGALLGFVMGAIGGAANYGLRETVGHTVGLSIMAGLGLGLCVKRDGWQGVFVFAAGFLGALAGGRVARELGVGPGVGGTTSQGEASITDIKNSIDYGPFDNTVDSYGDLENMLPNEGDMVFAKRPLGFMGSRLAGTPFTDRLNIDLLHEHFLWRENGVIKNMGFGPDGLFTESYTGDNSKLLSSYRFGPVLHGGNIPAVKGVFANYGNITYGKFGPNCQDFAEDVRGALY